MAASSLFSSEAVEVFNAAFIGYVSVAVRNADPVTSADAWAPDDDIVADDVGMDIEGDDDVIDEDEEDDDIGDIDEVDDDNLDAAVEFEQKADADGMPKHAVGAEGSERLRRAAGVAP